jgi:Flavin containing amine oxidoreductase
MVHNNGKLTFDVAVVGGGITGMYCSLRLAQKGLKVGLFERSDRWGGRIETVGMGKNKQFDAEYGPMRYDPVGQLLFNQLMGELKIEYYPFPEFQSAKPKWVDYDIKDEEELRWQEDPLALLLMGILKILGKYRNGMSREEMYAQLLPFQEVLFNFNHFRQTARMHGKPDGELLYTIGFWNALSDVMSHQAILKLQDFGSFYHLISENPNAIEWIIWWIRNLNPAAKLVGIKGGSGRINEEMLKKLDSFENLTRRENYELTSLHSEGNLVRLSFNKGQQEVIAKHIILALPKYPLDRLSHHFPEYIQKDLDSVIAFPLAKIFFVTEDPWWDEDTEPQTGADIIPTRELHYYQERSFILSEHKQKQYEGELNQKIVSQDMRDEFQKHNIDLPQELEVTVKENGIGWNILDPSNSKIHNYFVRKVDFSVLNKNGQGMVMLYTDRPASEYWTNYICDLQNHDRPEINVDKRLAERFCKYLLDPVSIKLERMEKGEDPHQLPTQELSQEQKNWLQKLFPLYFLRSQNQSTDKKLDVLTEDLQKLSGKITEFGIINWGLPPYGAGSHAWRPKAKSWEIIDRVTAFSLADDKEDCQNIHICGEAYSGHQAFIEGCLRSAEEVLTKIYAQESIIDPRNLLKPLSFLKNLKLPL